MQLFVFCESTSAKFSTQTRSPNAWYSVWKTYGNPLLVLSSSRHVSALWKNLYRKICYRGRGERDD